MHEISLNQHSASPEINYKIVILKWSIPLLCWAESALQPENKWRAIVCIISRAASRAIAGERSGSKGSWILFIFYAYAEMSASNICAVSAASSIISANPLCQIYHICSAYQLSVSYQWNIGKHLITRHRRKYVCILYVSIIRGIMRMMRENKIWIPYFCIRMAIKICKLTATENRIGHCERIMKTSGMLCSLLRGIIRCGSILLRGGR